jgi:hypothetical protein
LLLLEKRKPPLAQLRAKGGFFAPIERVPDAFPRRFLWILFIYWEAEKNGNKNIHQNDHGQYERDRGCAGVIGSIFMLIFPF